MSVILRTRNSLSAAILFIKTMPRRNAGAHKIMIMIAPPKITYHAVGVLDTKDNFS